MVGGGLAGLLAAWRGVEAGLETVVLDAPDRPAAASVAAGMVAPVGEASWGEERLLELSLGAAERWPDFAERVAAASGVEVPFRRCGALHVALDRDEAAELRRRDRLLERSGLEAEPLLGSAAREREPALSTAVGAATLAPREAEVDPRKLLEALTVACRSAGVRMLETEVAAITAAGEISTTSGARIGAGRVVLAAGAWAGASGLLPDELRLPIRPVKGEIVRLRCAPADLPVERIVVGERFYLVPRRSGELVLGATSEEQGFDLRVTAGGVHELLREAYRALPELAELELAEIAAGLRPGSPDNAPIVGRLADSAIVVAGGLYRNGVLLAPALSDAFDMLLAHDALPAELDDLGPDRFLGERETEKAR